jgi:hypothetical protein
MGYKTIHGIMPITYQKPLLRRKLKIALFGAYVTIAPDVMNRFGTRS